MLGLTICSSIEFGRYNIQDQIRVQGNNSRRRFVPRRRNHIG
jgi:hypothetical protein